MTRYDQLGYANRFMQWLRICLRFPDFEDRHWEPMVPDMAIADWVFGEYVRLKQRWLAETRQLLDKQFEFELLEDDDQVAIHVKLEAGDFIGAELLLLPELQRRNHPLYEPVLWLFHRFEAVGFSWSYDHLRFEIDMIESGCGDDGETDDYECHQMDEESGSCNCRERVAFLQAEQEKADRWHTAAIGTLITEGQVRAMLQNFKPRTETEGSLARWITEHMDLLTGEYTLEDLTPDTDALEVFYSNGEAYPAECIRFIWDAERVHNIYVAPGFDETYNQCGHVTHGFLLTPGDAVDVDRMLRLTEWFHAFTEAMDQFDTLQYKFFDELNPIT